MRALIRKARELPKLARYVGVTKAQRERARGRFIVDALKASRGQGGFLSRKIVRTALAERGKTRRAARAVASAPAKPVVKPRHAKTLRKVALGMAGGAIGGGAAVAASGAARRRRNRS